MTSFRKLLFILFVCITVLALLSACGDSDADIDDADSWEFDLYTHWHLTEDGEKIDEAEHTYEEGCLICNIDLFYYDDGSVYVQKYNGNGDVSVMVYYDSDGNLAEETRIDYIYNENGNATREIMYRNGKLYLEAEYAVVIEDDDYSYAILSKLTRYNSDGTKLVEDFDSYTQIYSETLYNADGSVAHEYRIETEYDDNDNIIRYLKYDGDILAEEVTCEYGDFEEYDEYDCLVLQRTFVYGTLIKEEFYTRITESGFDTGSDYIFKEIIYNADGTQTVTEYDQYGRVK